MEGSVPAIGLAWTCIILSMAVYVYNRFKGRLLFPKYQKRFFAAMMNVVERIYNKDLGRRKEELFGELHQLSDEARPRPLSILEVGAGTGTNFRYIPKGSNVMCIDPNPYFESYLQSKRELFADVNITEFVVGHGEDLSASPDNSLDAVVCTLVLCSVDDPDQCLREFRRVLKPGGKFFFMEHVSADKTSWVHTFQKVMRPWWFHFAVKCDPTRQTDRIIESAGFSRVSQKRFTAPLKFLFLTPHLMGVATK